MATKSGRVTLHGRFPAGTRVRLVKVRDESVLRAEGGEEIDVKRVDDDGRVHFSSGVEVGARYLIVGRVNGVPVEVRARGNDADAESSVLAQPPIRPDRTRLADGSWSDEPPAREKAPSAASVSVPSQQQARGVVQRSSTPRGEATPVDVREELPYPSQENVKKGTVQMSATPVGRATPIADTPERQDQVPAGVVQRSATPVGVATIIPSGDAVAAKQERDSSVGKAMRGEPGRVAAEPLEVPKASASSKRSKRATPSGGGQESQPKRSAGSKTRAAGTSVKGAKGAAGVKTTGRSKK